MASFFSTEPATSNPLALSLSLSDVPCARREPGRRFDRPTTETVHVRYWRYFERFWDGGVLLPNAFVADQVSIPRYGRVSSVQTRCRRDACLFSAFVAGVLTCVRHQNGPTRRENIFGCCWPSPVGSRAQYACNNDSNADSLSTGPASTWGGARGPLTWSVPRRSDLHVGLAEGVKCKWRIPFIKIPTAMHQSKPWQKATIVITTWTDFKSQQVHVEDVQSYWFAEQYSRNIKLNVKWRWTFRSKVCRDTEISPNLRNRVLKTLSSFQYTHLRAYFSSRMKTVKWETRELSGGWPAHAWKILARESSRMRTKSRWRSKQFRIVR